MIPVLYKATETEFTSQGIGPLSDALSCTVTEERNGEYELEMTYPITGVHYNDIQINTLILSTHGHSSDTQPFRVYQISKPLNGKVAIYAEHISYQLSYIPVKPCTASSCASALNALIDNSMESNPFKVWTDKNTTARYTQTVPASFRSRLGGTDGSILDTYGGEYEFDRFTVKLHEHRGSDNGVVIEYGKNLTDVTQEENISNVFTGVVPYWAKEDDIVTLDTAVQSGYADKYPFRRTAVKDFSDEFDEKPTQDQLRSRCESYMNSNLVGVPEVSIDVSFVNLSDTEEYKYLSSEDINLCDTVMVRFDELGIDAKAKVIKTEYNVIADRYNEISIGDARATFADTVNNIKDDQEQQKKDFMSNLVASIAKQKELLTGGLGGNIVINYVNGLPSEIVIGDTNDIKTMSHCLVINMNGIGFSDGYGKEVRSAWTIDGNFSATWMTTGIIQDKKGINYINLDTGELRLGGVAMREEFNAWADSLQKQINDANNEIANNYSELTRFIRFKEGQIILGAIENALSLVLSNDRISFRQDEGEVAYITNNQLYITDAVFLNKVYIGNWGFVPQQSGNLTFKKIK